ncbi:gluconokinase [Agaribacter flavus]|uniref:gluconokinase n=1 Tax=Agaribacter flavus TaxID=1902781 RepID=A0ABV7FV41_9ALTE
MTTLTTVKDSLIVIMGVSGTGKSSLAQQIATDLEAEYVDADDHHSDEAKEMMSAGIPLNDGIRDAWITRLKRHILATLGNHQSCVLAYSGLKTRQRKRIIDCSKNTQCFLLDVPYAILEQRLASRTQFEGHFFNPDLLQSQFDSFEAITPDENVHKLDGTLKLETLSQIVLNKLLS